MNDRIRFAVLVVALIGLMGGALWGGGFLVVAETPGEQAPEGTVAVVRPLGCHRPAEASFAARAEGWVEGQRQTIRLDQQRIEGGALAIQRQWPDRGIWVLAVEANYNGFTRSLLINLDPQTREPMLNGPATRKLSRSLTEIDIRGALDSLRNSPPTE